VRGNTAPVEARAKTPYTLLAANISRNFKGKKTRQGYALRSTLKPAGYLFVSI
jgi:hypothetical protein